MSNVVAIDGPAGAGKSTVSGRLARKLHLPLLRQGELYRAASLVVIAHGGNLNDERACIAILRRHTFDIGEDSAVAVDSRHRSGTETADSSDAASKLAVMPRVRALLLAPQRELALRHGGCVAEGRDTGTAVFPEARLKVWLDAEPAIRARRIAATRGLRDAEVAVLRDRRETESPTQLGTPGPGAVLIDSTRLDDDDVLTRLCLLAHERRVGGRQ